MDCAKIQPDRKEYRAPQLAVRDAVQLKTAQIIYHWNSLKAKQTPPKKSLFNFETVEGVVSVCLRYGLFEEALAASMNRRRPGLTTVEVEASLKALLMNFLPYSPFGLGDACYDRFSIRSYPPFVELLQAVSDDFRLFIEKECL